MQGKLPKATNYTSNLSPLIFITDLASPLMGNAETLLEFIRTTFRLSQGKIFLIPEMKHFLCERMIV